MLLQMESTKCKKEIRKKDKKIYERKRRSLTTHLSLFPPKRRKRLSTVKVSLRTSFWKKGSLAVETALVLPIFFMGMVTLISFMDIYQLQTEHLSQLCTKAKQAGMYAYLAGGSDAGDITLPDVYTYEPFGGLVPLPKTIIYNHVKVHAWTGTVFEDNGENQGDTETMVYVKQVSGSSVLSMNNQYGEHYSACETCSRNEKPAGIVYVTDQGNRYHNLESCSGLKRSVRLVKESSVSGMGTCSRCG